MKLIKKYFLISLVFLASCSGSSLVEQINSAATALESVTKTLSLITIRHGTPDSAGNYPEYDQENGTKVFENSEGIQITIDKVYISWKSFELISEGDDEECEAGNDALISLDLIEDFMQTDLEEFTIISDSIVDTSFCQYEITISDDNASFENIEDYPEIEGLAIFISGTYESGLATESFEVEIAGEFTKTANFQTKDDDGNKIDHPFHFHEEEDSGEVMIGNKYDKWFDGVDFTESSEDLADKVKSNFLSSMHQHLHSHQ